MSKIKETFDARAEIKRIRALRTEASAGFFAKAALKNIGLSWLP